MTKQTDSSENWNREKSRFGLCLRSLSLILCFSFILTDISHAAPRLDSTPRDIFHNPGLLKISPSTAKITDFHQGTKLKLLIHIQDAHTNTSAQANCAAVLEELIQRYGLKTIFMEGGTRDDSLTFLRPLAEKSARERVAKKYLRQGELNGAEYLNLVSDYDIRLLGVEEKTLYEKSLEDYAAIVKEREEILGYIQEIEKRVETLKRKFFPKEVLMFDAFLRSFEKKEKDFTEYHAFLSDFATRLDLNLLTFPNFFVLKELKTKEEQIDFAKANAEQARLVAGLYTTNPAGPAGMSVSSPKSLIGDRVDSRLRGNDVSVQKLKSGLLTPLSFYESLLNDAKKHALILTNFPNLVRYLDYLKTYEKVDLAKLLSESKSLERQIFEQSLVTRDSKTLHAISDYLKTLEKLFSLQAQKEDFDDYAHKKEDVRFETVVLLGFLNKKLAESGNAADVIRFVPAIDETVKKVEDFYKTTEQRDAVFLEKALGAMDRDHTSLAVLLTGGYHTPHLSRLMREKGVSYVVVTPNVTHETNIKRYEELLLSQLGPTRHSESPQFRFAKQSGGEEESHLSLAAAVERPFSPVPAIEKELPQLAAAARLASPASTVEVKGKNKIGEYLFRTGIFAMFIGTSFSFFQWLDYAFYFLSGGLLTSFFGDNLTRGNPQSRPGDDGSQRVSDVRRRVSFTELKGVVDGMISKLLSADPGMKSVTISLLSGTTPPVELSDLLVANIVEDQIQDEASLGEATQAKIKTRLGRARAERGVFAVSVSKFSTSAEGHILIEKLAAAARLAIQTISVPEEDLKFPITFGTAGWRVATNSGFTDGNVSRFAQAIANYLIDQAGKTGRPIHQWRVAVGYDARPGGPSYAKRIVEVLAANGIHIDFINQINTTPTLAESTRPGLSDDQRYDLAIQITASHNSVYVNMDSDALTEGVKVLQLGVPGSDDITGAIAAMANDPKTNRTYQYLPYDEIPKGQGQLMTEDVDLIAKTTERMQKVFDFEGMGKKLKTMGVEMVIDSMHGGTVQSAAIFEKLGIVSERLKTESMEVALGKGLIPAAITDPDSRKKIRWRPEPVDFLLEELRSKTKQGMFGVGFDGDGDRAYFIDINGKPLSPNEIGLIFADYLQSKGERGPLVRTIPSTHTLDRLARLTETSLIKIPVGSKNFKPYATGEKEDLLVGVEESGHILFKYKGEIFVDSTIAETLLALEIIAETGKSLSEYLDNIHQKIGKLYFVRTAVDPAVVTQAFVDKLRGLRDKGVTQKTLAYAKGFAEAVAKTLNKELAPQEPFDASDANGVYVEFKDGSWAMYRTSGTELVVRVYAEANSQEELTSLVKAVNDEVIARAAARLGESSNRHSDPPRSLAEKNLITVMRSFVAPQSGAPQDDMTSAARLASGDGDLGRISQSNNLPMLFVAQKIMDGNALKPEDKKPLVDLRIMLDTVDVNDIKALLEELDAEPVLWKRIGELFLEDRERSRNGIQDLVIAALTPSADGDIVLIYDRITTSNDLGSLLALWDLLTASSSVSLSQEVKAELLRLFSTDNLETLKRQLKMVGAEPVIGEQIGTLKMEFRKVKAARLSHHTQSAGQTPEYKKRLLEGVGELDPDWARLEILSQLILQQPGSEILFDEGAKDSPGLFRDQVLQSLKNHGLDSNAQHVFHLMERLVSIGLLRLKHRKTSGNEMSATFEIAAPKREMAVKMGCIAFIRDDLKKALSDFDPQSRPEDPQVKNLGQLFLEYSEIAQQWPLYPVERRWPVLKAIAGLGPLDQKKIVDFFERQDGRMRSRFSLVDTMLLMLQSSYPDRWANTQVPNVLGRTIYILSPEIWNVAGGLGRVCQYLAVAIRKLVGIQMTVATIEPYYLYLLNHKREKVAVDYSQLPTAVENLGLIDEFQVTVRGKRKPVHVYKGINKHGIEVYLIKDPSAPEENMANMMYKYGREHGYSDWDEFAAYFSRASHILMERLETRKKENIGEKYQAPIILANDGQSGFLPVLKRLANGSVSALTDAVVWMTTHTYRNRSQASVDFPGKEGLPHEWDPYFQSRFSPTDITSAGLRTADGANAVSAIQKIETELYDPGLGVYAITNGDDRAYSASIFRSLLLEANPGIDLEHPTPAQVMDAKRRAKKLLSEDARLLDITDGAIAKLDPEKIVISYSGRLVPEKAGRDRAFCDENIQKMVEAGAQVLLFGNVQSSADSAKIYADLKNLESEINNKGFPGRLIVVSGWGLPEQLKLLAATDIQMQDSDRDWQRRHPDTGHYLGTGAAEYTEADVSANGGLQSGPPWIEGVIQRQGIILDRTVKGSGNTLIPKDRRPASYWDMFSWAIELFKKDREHFASYQAASVRISRILGADITAAEYLRQFDRLINRRENPLFVLEKYVRGESEAWDVLKNEWYRKELSLFLRRLATAMPFDSTNPHIEAFLVDIDHAPHMVLIDRSMREYKKKREKGFIRSGRSHVFKRLFERMGISPGTRVDVVDSAKKEPYGTSATLEEEGLYVEVPNPGIQVLHFEPHGTSALPSTHSSAARLAEKSPNGKGKKTPGGAKNGNHVKRPLPVWKPTHTPAKITIIGGAGFVGLTTGVMAAVDFGHDVTAIDIDDKKDILEKLNKGELPHLTIPKFDDKDPSDATGDYQRKLVKKAVEGYEDKDAEGKPRVRQLQFRTVSEGLKTAVDSADFIFLAVPTPQSDSGEADIRYLERAVTGIAKSIQPGAQKIIIGKSTAPPYIIDHLESLLRENLSEAAKTNLATRIDFAWMPEFLREGKEADDDRQADRVVIGARKREVAEKVKTLFENPNPYSGRIPPEIVMTDIKSAMLIKYAANGFRALKITFIIFISWFCEVLGFDVDEVANAIGADIRVVNSFLKIGPGYGGSCFPKDVAACVHMLKIFGVFYGLLKDILMVNDLQWRKFVEKIDQDFGEKEKMEGKERQGVHGKNIIVLGASFKENTSDVRDSRTLKIVEELIRRGAKVRVYDPNALAICESKGSYFRRDPNVRCFTEEEVNGQKQVLEAIVVADDTTSSRYQKTYRIWDKEGHSVEVGLKPVEISGDFHSYELMRGQHAIVLATGWETFEEINFKKLSKNIFNNHNPPFIFDSRNLFKDQREELSRLGFKHYVGLGLGLGEKTNEEFNAFIEEVRCFFLALRVSYINTFAELAGKLSANINDVKRGLGLDRVVGLNFLSPGLGWGGSKLFSALVEIARKFDEKIPTGFISDDVLRKLNQQGLTPFDSMDKMKKARVTPFVSSARDVNDRQIDRFVRQARKAVGGSLRGKVVAVLGLAYKAEEDTIEKSRTIDLIRAFLREGAIIRASDVSHQAVMSARREFQGDKDVLLCDPLMEAVDGSDVQIIATNSKEFKNWRPIFVKSDGSLRPKTLKIIDGRHVYDENYDLEQRQPKRPIIEDMKAAFPHFEYYTEGFTLEQTASVQATAVVWTPNPHDQGQPFTVGKHQSLIIRVNRPGQVHVGSRGEKKSDGSWDWKDVDDIPLKETKKNSGIWEVEIRNPEVDVFTFKWHDPETKSDRWEERDFYVDRVSSPSSGARLAEAPLFTDADRHGQYFIQDGRDVVVIVEDDSAILGLYQDLLEEKRGFQFLMATDLRQAQNAVRTAVLSNRLKLVITDMEYPINGVVIPKEFQDPAGVFLVKYLREDLKNPNVPILVASSHAMNRRMEELFPDPEKRGPIDYLEKPVDIFNFLKKVKKNLTNGHPGARLADPTLLSTLEPYREILEEVPLWRYPFDDYTSGVASFLYKLRLLSDHYKRLQSSSIDPKMVDFILEGFETLSNDSGKLQEVKREIDNLLKDSDGIYLYGSDAWIFEVKRSLEDPQVRTVTPLTEDLNFEELLQVVAQIHKRVREEAQKFWQLAMRSSLFLDKHDLSNAWNLFGVYQLSSLHKLEQELNQSSKSLFARWLTEYGLDKLVASDEVFRVREALFKSDEPEKTVLNSDLTFFQIAQIKEELESRMEKIRRIEAGTGSNLAEGQLPTLDEILPPLKAYLSAYCLHRYAVHPSNPHSKEQGEICAQVLDGRRSEFARFVAHHARGGSERYLRRIMEKTYEVAKELFPDLIEVEALKRELQKQRMALTVYQAFKQYIREWDRITSLAKKRVQEQADDRSIQDTELKLNLYGISIDETEATLQGIVGQNYLKDLSFWEDAQNICSGFSDDKNERPLLIIFFRSVQRQNFSGFGVPIEYEDELIQLTSTGSSAEVTTSFNSLYGDAVSQIDAELIKRILLNFKWDIPYEHLDHYANLAALRLQDQLRSKFKLGNSPIQSIEILNDVFYRNLGAYILGRINIGGQIIPIAFALVNEDERIKAMKLDFVMVGPDEVGLLFSTTRAHFHVNREHYRDIVRFLSESMPKRRLEEFYSAIGFIHPAKVLLRQSLRNHIQSTGEKFEPTPGRHGHTVMCFTLESFPYVFKLPLDEPRKSTNREQVLAINGKINLIDRVGELLDPLFLFNLEFDLSDFKDPEYIQQLAKNCSRSVAVDRNRNKVLFKILIAQEKVIPLHLFLIKPEVSLELKRRAMQSLYENVMNLFKASMINLDYFPFNFGVKLISGLNYLKVLSFDFDELHVMNPKDEEIDLARFAKVPIYWLETWLEAEMPDFTPEVERTVTDIYRILFVGEKWSKIREDLKKGKASSFYPYPVELRFRPPVEDDGFQKAARLSKPEEPTTPSVEELDPNRPPVIDRTMQESAAHYEKVTQATWYRTNTAYSLKDLIPSLKPDSVVYDSSAGTGAASLYLLEELARTGKKIDTLVLSDVDFPLARAFLAHAMKLLEPYRAQGVVQNIRYFVLKKKPHPGDVSKKVFALSSEIPGLRGKVDHVIFLNAFHVIPSYQVKSTLDGIFEVMKPGADLMIGSGSIDQSSPSYRGTVLIDTLFHKVYEKALAIVRQDPKFEHLKGKIETLNEQKAAEIKKIRNGFLPQAPVLSGVLNSLTSSHLDGTQTTVNFTLLQKEDYKPFIVGVPDYVRLNIPELAGEDAATVREILNRAYDEVYEEQSINGAFTMSWTTLTAKKPPVAGTRLSGESSSQEIERLLRSIETSDPSRKVPTPTDEEDAGLEVRILKTLKVLQEIMDREKEGPIFGQAQAYKLYLTDLREKLTEKILSTAETFAREHGSTARVAESIAVGLRPNLGARLTVVPLATAQGPLPIALLGLNIPSPNGVVAVQVREIKNRGQLTHILPQLSSDPARVFLNAPSENGNFRWTVGRQKAVIETSPQTAIFFGNIADAISSLADNEIGVLPLPMEVLLNANGTLKSPQDVSVVLGILRSALAFKEVKGKDVRIALYGSVSENLETAIQGRLKNLGGGIELQFVNGIDPQTVTTSGNGLVGAIENAVATHIPANQKAAFLGMLYSPDFSQVVGVKENVPFIETTDPQDTSAAAILVALAVGPRSSIERLPKELQDYVSRVSVGGRVILLMRPMPILDIQLFLTNLSIRSTAVSA